MNTGHHRKGAATATSLGKRRVHGFQAHTFDVPWNDGVASVVPEGLASRLVHPLDIAARQADIG